MNVDSEGGLRYTLFSNKRKKVTVHFVHGNFTGSIDASHIRRSCILAAGSY